MRILNKLLLATAFFALLLAAPLVQAGEWQYTANYIDGIIEVEDGAWANHTSYASYSLSMDTFNTTMGWNATEFSLLMLVNVTAGTNVSLYILDSLNHENLTLGLEPDEKLLEFQNISELIEAWTIPTGIDDPLIMTNETYYIIFDNQASTLNATLDVIIEIWEWYVIPTPPPPPIPFIELPFVVAVAVGTVLGGAYLRRKRNAGKV